MRVFLPVSIDQWRSPIASLMRSVVEFNPDIEFTSFSNPLGEEDCDLGEEFWKLPNLKMANASSVWIDRFDVVHTASLNPRNLAIAAYSKARGGSAFLTTLNLEADPSMGYRDWICFRIASRLADAWCAVSEAVAVRPNIEFLGRSEGIIPNGFDPVFFDPAVEDHVLLDSIDDGKPFALFLSALEPRKHPEFIVELATRNPDTRFVAAGWEHPSHARCYLPMMRSRPNLVWLGHVDRRRIRGLMKSAALLLFPSDREGHPLTVIEALGMGLPVVAQPKSSLPEILRDGENGFLVSIDEPRRWMSKIEEVLGWDVGRRAAFSARAREGVVAKFSWKSIGASYGPVYRRLVGES